jgi:hypothetical protein
MTSCDAFRRAVILAEFDGDPPPRPHCDDCARFASDLRALRRAMGRLPRRRSMPAVHSAAAAFCAAVLWIAALATPVARRPAEAQCAAAVANDACSPASASAPWIEPAPLWLPRIEWNSVLDEQIRFVRARVAWTARLGAD